MLLKFTFFQIEKGYLIKVNVVKIPAKSSSAKRKNIKKKEIPETVGENIPGDSPSVSPKKIKKTVDATPSRPKKIKMSADTPSGVNSQVSIKQTKQIKIS
jgi:hypothetical protein